MPRGRGGQHQPPRRPIDLTGTISMAEKNDLFTLVNAITEKIHKDISNIFDSPPVTSLENEHGHHHWLFRSLLHRNDKENKQPSSQPLSMAKGDGSKTYTKTHKIIDKEEKESLTPQLKELKKEALAFFRKWQNAVLQRMRDISINDPGGLQASMRGRGRGIRGTAPRGRGGRVNTNSRVLTLATGPARLPPNHVDPGLVRRCPPIPNHLWSLPLERRKLLLHIVLLVLASLQEYTANGRLLILYLTSSLNLPLLVFQSEEVRLAQGLAQMALEVPPDEESDQKPDENRSSRKWKLAHCSANSSGNLAAPLFDVGIGTPHKGLGLSAGAAAALLGPMADNGRLTGSLFGFNQPRPTSKMMESFAKDIADFAFLPLHGDDRSEYRDARQIPARDRRIRLVLAMSGWLCAKEDVEKPWLCLGNQAESFAIRWEVSVLESLGNSLETVTKSTAWSVAKKELTTRSVFSSLIDSDWPVPLLKISKIMDNPWNTGMVRAEKAGALLADAIMRSKFQGDRPVSLIGYSLAARAIYACLMVLAERRQFGIVDSVVLMGTPAPSESRVWLTLKSVVSGRLVNVYSEHDYILGFLYRTSNIMFGVAGLQDIQGADGVENHHVNLQIGHLTYQHIAGQVLKDIGWEDVDNKKLVRMDKN